MNKIVSVITVLCLSLTPTSSIILNYDSTLDDIIEIEIDYDFINETGKDIKLKVTNKLKELEELEKARQKQQEQIEQLKFEIKQLNEIQEEKEREIQQQKAESDVANNRWDITLTSDEIDLLAKIVWLEARGESDLGKQAVVEVVFNRMIHEYFQGSLYEVLSSRNQFSTWKNKNIAKPTDSEYDAINKVLNGKTNILPIDTVYFSTSPRNSNIVAHIGCHYFCR